MKFSLLATAGILSAISQASAVTIVNPWASTTWTSGGTGEITWTSTAAEATLKCDIYLLNGNFTNSNIVAQITNPATPVACSANQYSIYPLNDFAAGQYWIRIGQSATNTWAYSGLFSFVGKGTVGPVSVAGSPSSATAVPSAVASSNSSSSAVSSSASAASSGAATATGAKANATASLAAAAASSKSGAESAMSINSAAVALGAIAAIAFSL